MATLSFQTTISAVVQILLMGFCGYALVKFKKLDEPGLNLLTRLLILFFLPQFMFYHLTHSFRFETYPNWWLFPIIGFLLVMGGGLVSWGILSVCPSIQHKREFMALTIFQNSGYIPFLVVSAIFTGEVAQRLYVYILLLLIGFNLSMWSLGVWLIARGKGKNFTMQNLFNPPLLAMVISLVIIALGIHQHIPPVVNGPLKMFSDCVLPMAMIVVGGNLAQVKLEAVNKGELLTVVLVKLIVCPLIALVAVLVLNLDFLMGFLVVLEAVVPSAVTLSIIARYYTIEQKFITQGIFFTHLVSLITMPAFLMWYVYLMR